MVAVAAAQTGFAEIRCRVQALLFAGQPKRQNGVPGRCVAGRQRVSSPMKQADQILFEDMELKIWATDVGLALHRVPGKDQARTIVNDISVMLLEKRYRDTVMPEGQLFRFLQAFNLSGMLADEDFNALMSRLRNIAIRLNSKPATEVFEAIKVGIDKAVEAESFISVCNLADELRMEGGEDESSTSLSYLYEYQGNDGKRVTLHVRSYDPSGAFQNRPDVNRFTVELWDGQGCRLARYEQSYSD